MNDKRDKIVEILARYGITYSEKGRTIKTACPLCGRADKFSILKVNGHCICYHGKCDFNKGWFEKFLSLSLKVSYKEARDIFRGQSILEAGDIKADWFDDEKEQLQEDKTLIMDSIPWPPPDCVLLDDTRAEPGVAYLLSRGIPSRIASAYGIVYNTVQRRIVFPVVIDEIARGWQARAIDPNNEWKMLNNEGFVREKLVMFADLLSTSDHVILCEGPVDAIKFCRVRA
jgi:hypothetical protein